MSCPSSSGPPSSAWPRARAVCTTRCATDWASRSSGRTSTACTGHRTGPGAIRCQPFPASPSCSTSSARLACPPVSHPARRWRGSSGTSGASACSGRFAVLAGVDRVGGVGKPAPDVYQLASAELGRAGAIGGARGLRPRRGRRPGRRAGGGGGPSRITRFMSLTDADLVVDSMSAVSLDRARRPGALSGPVTDVAGRPSADAAASSAGLDRWDPH